MQTPSPKNYSYHKPVLLQSALHFLNVIPGGLYVDATLGGGGHTQAILAAGGKVLGLDQDPEAFRACPPLDNLVKVQANFTHLTDIVHQYHWQPLAGVLFDLGVSSHHLDDPTRGFSFQQAGPLDMRMDPGQPHTAATLLNTLAAVDLAHIFTLYGEIPAALSLANKLTSARPLASTTQLARLVGPRHTRQVFQALRIAVNDELGALSTALPQAYDLLAPSGRLVLISFHSLEDRIVKHFFQSARGTILTPKPIRCDSLEVSLNSRCKSAKLRAFQKV